jgi:hypothetical protein
MISSVSPAEDVLRSNVARDIHRIGGGEIDNLRLKAVESTLSPPGISVLKSGTPGEAARQIRAAFPNATQLHQLAETVGSTSEELILSVGFQLFPNPTKRFPNHYRITHADGVAGFTDANLERLSQVFVNSAGH